MESAIFLFNYIINKDESIKIVKLLDQMTKCNILSTELYLNIIKALILIFHIDKNLFNVYYDILNYINNNFYNDTLYKICVKLNSIDMSYQLELSEQIIENIIIYTNIFIMKDFTMDILENKLIFLLNLITTLQQLHISVDLKINIYINIIKNNTNMTDISMILSLVKKYITNL